MQFYEKIINLYWGTLGRPKYRELDYINRSENPVLKNPHFLSSLIYRFNAIQQYF